MHYVGLQKLKQATDLPHCLKLIFGKEYDNDDMKSNSDCDSFDDSQSGRSDDNSSSRAGGGGGDDDDFIVKLPKRQNIEGVQVRQFISTVVKKQPLRKHPTKK